MKRVEKKRGNRVVRLDFKRMVVGAAAVLLLAGLPGPSVASQDVAVKAAGDAAQKAVAKVVEKKDASEKAVTKATTAKNGEAKPKVPEFVDINTQKSCPDMKGLKKDIKHVNHFTHAAHIEMLKKENKGFVCATCHKGAKTEDDILKSDKCKRMEEELKETGGPAKLKNYFHSTCLKCHKDLKKENKKTGPVSCKGCHNRKAGDK